MDTDLSLAIFHRLPPKAVTEENMQRTDKLEELRLVLAKENA